MEIPIPQIMRSMRLRPITLLAAVLFFAYTTIALPVRSHATQQAMGTAAIDTIQSTFPIDPNVRIDTLSNGLRYYVRRNTEPRDRAELYLAVNAGSILEDDSQLGLAHFVEHMLFNGTRRYPNEELIAFLESTGMRFGPDVNAYTSFDETVYTLTIPTDSDEIVDGAFEVLQDWAAFATLSDSMIDKERGVVVEEWRMSNQNAQGRIREALYPVLLHDSRYAERVPIGTPEIIQNASYETIRRFYERWYRPDLMAVIAVGDFDADRFEQLIRDHFDELDRPASPSERALFGVPEHERTLFKVITDPEFTYATVTAYYKQTTDLVETIDDYRRRLVGRLFNGMLNQRLTEIARRADAPFLGASVFKGAFARPAQFYGASAQVHEDSVLVGLRAVLTEVARVRRHGFAETELDRQKQNVLRAYRRAHDEREKTHSSAFARHYVSHFLENEPIPGIELEYDVVQRLIPGISLDDVHALASDLLATENRVVVSILPEKDGVTPPSEQQLQAVLASVIDADVDPYIDAVHEQPLIASVPDPTPITRQTTIDEIGAAEIELANGVRIVMKPTDFKEDEIVMSGFSPGGSSLVPDSAAFSAEMAPQLVSRSGVGSFDRTALEKQLSGKVVSVSPFVRETEEGFRGSASPEDVETLLQLTYLYFAEPRGEHDALVAFQNQMRSALINRSANPNAVFQDSVQAALYGRAVRRVTPTMQMVESLSIDDALRHYRDRFADAGDFTFVFVGSFDVDALTELVQRYLGALPSTGRDETWRDVAPAKPEGIVERDVRKGIGEQSYVTLVFHGPFESDRLHRHRIRSLGDALSIVLRRELREAMSGVYGVSVSPSTSARPNEEYSFSISFGCAPERVEELTLAVFDQIARMKEVGPGADVVATVKEQQQRGRETDLRRNGFWSGVLEFYYTHDEDVLDVLRYDELIESLTAEEVQAAARAYLNLDRYVEVVLYPEDVSQDGGGSGASNP